MYEPTEESSQPGFVQRLLRIGGDFLSIFCNHFKLATIEAREEALTLVRLLLFWLVVLQIAVFSLMLLNIGIIVYIAQSSDKWAGTIIGFGIFYGIAACILGGLVYRWWKNRPPAFNSTTHELDKSKEWLTQLWHRQ